METAQEKEVRIHGRGRVRKIGARRFLLKERGSARASVADELEPLGFRRPKQGARKRPRKKEVPKNGDRFSVSETRLGIALPGGDSRRLQTLGRKIGRRESPVNAERENQAPQPNAGRCMGAKAGEKVRRNECLKGKSPREGDGYPV